MRKRCHLLTTSNTSPSAEKLNPPPPPQSTPRSTPPTCSSPKNISIVTTRSPLPFHYPVPPPPLPLPPTRRPHSANFRLVSTNRCLPHRLPSTNTFRPLVTPSTRTQSRRGFTHGAMATKRDEGTGELSSVRC